MNVKRGELKRAKHLPSRGVVKEFERAELVGPWLRLGAFVIPADEVEWCELEDENDGPVSSGPAASPAGGAGAKTSRRRGGSDIG